MNIYRILPLIIIAIGILMALSDLRAQNFVTYPKAEIQRHLESGQVKYSVNLGPDGFEYLHFQAEQTTVTYYFNHYDVCILYLVDFPDNQLKEMKNELNSSFQKIHKSMWREYACEQYFIWSLDKLVDGYSLTVVAEVSLEAMK